MEETTTGRLKNYRSGNEYERFRKADCFVETSLQVLCKTKPEMKLLCFWKQNWFEENVGTKHDKQRYFINRCKTQSVNQRNVIDACNDDRYSTADGVPQNDGAVSVWLGWIPNHCNRRHKRDRYWQTHRNLKLKIQLQQSLTVNNFRQKKLYTADAWTKVWPFGHQIICSMFGADEVA